jgi:hypothetical protein
MTMGFIHGKGVVITLATFDISAYSDNVAFNRKADSHDVTTFGKSSHVYQGGLLDGTATITGIYDSTATGPKAKIESLLGTNVVLTYEPEGVGTGKPLETGSVLITAYEETAPVADMIKFSITLQMSDTMVKSTQA